jgi:spore coat protein CotH
VRIAVGNPIRRRAAMLCAVIVLWTASATSAGAQTQEQFFDDTRVHDVRLTISSRDWETLKARAHEDVYYPADLRWQGITIRNVGIRSRGSGSRSGVKPGLRVDINRYLVDQDFLGLKAFVLDNVLTDASIVREAVAMKLYARLGLIVPREAPARLFINDEYVGAYVIVEAVDRTFVSRVFGEGEGDVEDGGYLFEYRWTRSYGFEYLGDRLESYAALFQPRTRETDSIVALFRPFEQLVRLVNESSPDRLVTDVGPLLDLRTFVRLLAAQNFLGELDGFVGNWGMNHFYLYRFRVEQPAQLVPWDADHTFSLPADLPIDHSLDTNVLTRGVMAVPALRRLYLEALLECAAVAMQLEAGDSRGWLVREIERQALLVEASVRADPVALFSAEDFEAEIELLRDFSRSRPSFVLCEVLKATELDPGRRCN